MTNRELYDLTLAYERDKEIETLVPILEDIKANEPNVYDKLNKLLNTYKRNLAVRLAENRQTTLNLDEEL